MTLLFLAACHTPVGWHYWTGEKEISQIGAVLGPAHFFLAWSKNTKKFKNVNGKTGVRVFSNFLIENEVISKFGISGWIPEAQTVP